MGNSAETTDQAVRTRLDALEMQITYQDEVIENLNKVIVEQWSKLDQMLARVHRLENRITDQQDGAAQDRPDDSRPPHW
jgi:SlyX protein